MFGVEVVMIEVVFVFVYLEKRNEEKLLVQENDEDVIFGQYIILEMKKIQDQRKKVLIKFKIQLFFFEIQYGYDIGILVLFLISYENGMIFINLQIVYFM